MPHIKLITKINAPVERCFDLSRSIDLHKISTSQSNEEAVAGITSGLISLNQTVTWRAKHFFVWQKLTSKITQYEPDVLFVDEMTEGAFKSIHHTHRFEYKNGETIMMDDFIFESPLGFLGRLANTIILTSYLKKLLIKRNKVIKEFAESDLWKKVLPN
ncbi:MAG TPA: SRPBCC family protein [Bacteroidia bacterium]|nr:SRPBCC family protein [Bacteroidia bacterium]